MSTKTRVDFHRGLLNFAEQLIPKHVGHYDGERCFNLATFLSELSTEVGFKIEPLAGQFELDPIEVARYLYCHMSLHGGDHPAGNTFRGFPILD